jgi:hypothetical protein
LFLLFSFVCSSINEVVGQGRGGSSGDIRVPYADGDKYDLLKKFSSVIFDETVSVFIGLRSV